MGWDSQRKKQFRRALQDVYRSYGALSLFVAEEVGENLQAIAGQGALPEVAFALVDWADAKGRIQALYDAFCRENFNHPFAGSNPTAETIDSSAENRPMTPPQKQQGNIANDQSTINQHGDIHHHYYSSGDSPSPENDTEVPEGDRYISHQKIEQDCQLTLGEDGALLRIKAPHQMGKTALVNRLYSFSEDEKYSCVVIDFGKLEAVQLDDLDSFWRWFCQEIADELEIDVDLDQYWNRERFGSNASCEKYLQKAILKHLSTLVLILENVDRLFYTETSTIAEEVFRLVRAFHEKAKTSKPWRKLRQVLTYSTEPTAELNSALHNRSPFNVGMVIELPTLSHEQVMQLAGKFGLRLTAADGEQLMEDFGGHPALIQMGFERLVRSPQESVRDLYRAALQPMGSYSGHLDALEERLRKCSLWEVMQRVARSPEPVWVERKQGQGLYRLGLIDWEADNQRVRPRCRLYRDRFGMDG